MIHAAFRNMHRRLMNAEIEAEKNPGRAGKEKRGERKHDRRRDRRRDHRRWRVLLVEFGPDRGGIHGRRGLREIDPLEGQDHTRRRHHPPSARRELQLSRYLPDLGASCLPGNAGGFLRQPAAGDGAGSRARAREHRFYYDKPGEKALEALSSWTALYPGAWDGVIASKMAGIGDFVVLTAWTKRLNLERFDRAAAAAFIDLFRGRGPEHPVR